MKTMNLEDEAVGGLVDGFITMAVGGAVLIVGTFIVSEINESLDHANSEIDTIVSRIYSGMQIGGTAVLAVGAGLTIAALIGVGR